MFIFGKVFFKHSWPLFQGMLRLSDAPFRAVRPQQGFFCPWVNSLPILDLCPCGLRNGCSVYSLEDQHASLWPWPSHSYSASCRSRRCSWPLLFKAFSWGNTCGNILCTAGRARGTSVCLFILFVPDESPPQQLHLPLSFKEPVIKLTTQNFQSNQTLLLYLIVFQLY